MYLKPSLPRPNVKFDELDAFLQTMETAILLQGHICHLFFQKGGWYGVEPQCSDACKR